jgi:hypothetical protein
MATVTALVALVNRFAAKHNEDNENQQATALAQGQ